MSNEGYAVAGMEQESALATAEKYAVDCLAQGMSDADIAAAFVAQGWDDASARAVTARARYQLTGEGPAAPVQAQTRNFASTALERAERSANRDAAMKNMLVGGAIGAVGLVITIGSLMAAKDGGQYVVAWGAVVFGGIQFFRGLIGLMAS